MGSYNWELFVSHSGEERRVKGWNSITLDEAWQEVECAASGWINDRLSELRAHLLYLKQNTDDPDVSLSELEKYERSGALAAQWAREAGGIGNLPGSVSPSDVSNMETGSAGGGNVNRDKERCYKVHGSYHLIGRVEPA